jgi:hypothetical protein
MLASQALYHLSHSMSLTPGTFKAFISLLKWVHGLGALLASSRPRVQTLVLPKKNGRKMSSSLFVSGAWSFWEVGIQLWCFPWCQSSWAPTHFLTQLSQTWMIQLVSSVLRTDPVAFTGNSGIAFCSVAMVVWFLLFLLSLGKRVWLREPNGFYSKLLLLFS